MAFASCLQYGALEPVLSRESTNVPKSSLFSTFNASCQHSNSPKSLQWQQCSQQACWQLSEGRSSSENGTVLLCRHPSYGLWDSHRCPVGSKEAKLRSQKGLLFASGCWNLRQKKTENNLPLWNVITRILLILNNDNRNGLPDTGLRFDVIYQKMSTTTLDLFFTLYPIF